MGQVVGEGLLHLLDRDLTTLCGCPFGLVAGSAKRATCPTCLAICEQTKGEHIGPSLADEIGH